MNIEQFIDDIIKREGGYSDHPSDKGGKTMYGITENVARAFGYSGDMKTMPMLVARQIYRQRYWIQPKFDQVAKMSPAIAEELLDTGVNMGQSTAGKFLQRALNTLNRQAADFPDIGVDGAIGSITLHALKSYLDKRGAAGETVLLRMLNAQQSVRYMEIAERDQKQEDFMHGWQFNRVT